MKISVIIPALKRDELCERAVESVRRSVARGGDAEGEIIVVEGVSPVGAARNEGLERATGEWIAWVDADDEVEASWFGEIVNAIAANSDADVVSFDATVEWADGSGRKPYRVGGAAKAEDVMAERVAGQLWNKVIRRSLFDGLSFDGAIHEDYRLLAALLPRAGRVIHIEKSLYRYRRRGDGLSQYADQAGALEVLRELVRWHGEQPAEYSRPLAEGIVQRLVDYMRRCGRDGELKRFVRRNVALVLADPRLSVRVKVKCLLGAL